MNTGAPNVRPRGLRTRHGRRLIVVLFALMAGLAAAPAGALAIVTTATIQGTARDANTNAPVAGVAVQAYDSSKTAITATGATTTTASDGTYTLTVPTTGTNQNFYVGFAKAEYDPNFYLNAATLAGASPIPLVSGAAATGIDAALNPTPGTVAGVVKDATTGTGVAGVPVQVYDTSGNSFIASGTTLANGSYSITGAGLTAGQYKVFFEASSAGDYGDVWYLSKAQAAQADLVTVHGGQTTTLQDQSVAQLTGHITGRVTDAGGTPVQGISVDASGPNGESSATTGPAGTYTITGLPTGDYLVSFDVPANRNLVSNYYNNASGRNSASQVHVITGQTTPGIDSTLQTGGTVSGTVTKAADGLAVSGASVQILDGSGSSVRGATTAANGQYSVTGLASGTYFVSVRPPAGVNIAQRYYGGGSDFGSAQPVNVTAGQTTGSINVALPTAGQISGKVTDSAGHPVSGANIILRDNTGSTVTDGGVLTAADGTYTLVQVPPGTFTVEAIPNSTTLASTFYGNAPNSQQATAVPVAAGQSVSGINVSLPVGAGLSGKVTLASSGAPVGGVSVSVLDSAGNEITATGTDADGTYRFTNVFPTAVKVLFTTSTGLGFQYYNNAATLDAATPVNLTSGNAATGINAALSPGGTVSGKVTDAATHVLVPNVAVTLLDAQGNPVGPGGFTQPDGTYTIYGVAPGTYSVRFSDNSGHRPPYRAQYLGGSVQLAGSKTITVTAGQTTSGVDAALVPENAPAPTGTTPPPPPPVTVIKTVTAPPVTAGRPALSRGALGGLRKRHAVLRLTVTGGTGGTIANVIAVRIGLPKGLSFTPGGLARGLRVAGGTAAANARSGSLLVALQKPSHSLTLTLSDKLLAVSKSLAASVKKKKTKSIAIPVEVDNASGVAFRLVLRFTKLG